MSYLKYLIIDVPLPFDYNEFNKEFNKLSGRRGVMNKEEKQVAKSKDTNSENAKLKDIPRDAWVVGSEYNFWLNDKDDVYDELYKDV
ncbi:hypothetical protein POTG_03697 [Paenibacillus sp. oral taxon 786 str. D14]|nr:hypothetical protein POTG_03697 [Paenibacillus sp. oral taxon 786 str. D14]